MKNLIQYLKLWQKKRDELRVDTDAASDWLDMSALLDKHMPADDNSDGASPRRGMTLLSTVLITLAAAAMLYVGRTVIETKKKTAYHKDTLYHKKQGFGSGTDSLKESDRSKQNGEKIINGDSAFSAQNAVDAVSNKNNNGLSVKADSANSQNTSVQLNSDDKKAVTDKPNAATSSNTAQLAENKKPDIPVGKSKVKNGTQINEQSKDASSNSSQLLANNKKLNSPERRGKGKNNTQTGEQSQNLSSNSPDVLNKKNNSKKLNSPANASNGKIDRLAKLSGKDQGTFADNRTRYNADGSYVESNLNTANRNQHYTSNNQTLVLVPNGRYIGVNPEFTNTYPTLKSKPLLQTNLADISKTKKNKANADTSNIIWEWGVLLGANSNGSFTSKNQNKNFYGSLPADVFTGLYANYNFSRKWGVGTQINILSPQIENGGTYAGLFLNTTGGITTVDFKSINNSRKVYSIQVPLYAVYHLTKSIGFKAGPVVSFPVKQVSTLSAADTVNNPVLVTAQYQKKTNYSLLGGINYRYKRITFGADYLKGITKHYVISDTLVHQGTNNTFQFSIKYRLGGKKK